MTWEVPTTTQWGSNVPVEMVVFDCDGVLVDSERIAARVTSTILTAFGWPLDEREVVDRFVGCTDEYFCAEVERHLGAVLPTSWAADLEAATTAAFGRELAPVAGVEQVLDAVETLGLRSCVASNGSRKKIGRSLTLTGLWERFGGRVFSAEDVARGKPAPDLYEHAAAMMGVAPRRCIVVEDSPRGIEAALAAGMRVIGYAGLLPPHRLAVSAAGDPDVRVVTSMTELAGVLADSAGACLPSSSERP
jgi:HAD superfamily hydrolase (TIGR01509 family)